MPSELTLLPIPKKVELRAGEFRLPSESYVVLASQKPQGLWSAARRLNTALDKYVGLRWNVVACPVSQPAALTVSDTANGIPAQSYKLSISPEGINIRAGDAAGAFYGIVTLIQIIQQCEQTLPCLEIEDRPDYPSRGVMLDISRDKVYSQEYLLNLIDQLAGYKINQLQLYVEHTFAYPEHRDVWEPYSPVTPEDILELDKACQELHIELVPNQNSFGHLAHWLIVPRYAHLAEIHGAFNAPWGAMEGPFSVSPAEPDTLPFIKGLYDQYLPHFTSSMFNIGCDETFDLGAGKSKALVEARGEGVVYLEYLLELYKDVTGRGKTVQFWGDIINRHPELVARLPKDMIALEWGYEAGHPFDHNCASYAAAGVPFYVCPGTSAWNSIAGRTDNCLGNLRNAAENGLKHGATGYLNTDWGDNGHWQTASISYLGFAMGGAYSWNTDAAPEINVAEAVSLFAFEDPTGTAGKLAYELGNVYRKAGFEPGNSSALWHLWTMSFEQIADHPLVSREGLQASLAATDEAVAHAGQANIGRADAALILEEFRLAARMLRHACQRGLFAINAAEKLSGNILLDDLNGIIGEYEQIWNLRNRPGGLKDSTKRLYTLRADYQAA